MQGLPELQRWWSNWSISYEDILRELGLFSLEKWRLRQTLPMCINTWWKAWRWGSQAIFSGASDKATGNEHMWKHKRFLLNISKHFFTPRVTEQRSREVVESPCFEMFKTQLAMVLSPALGDPACSGSWTGQSPGVPYSLQCSEILPWIFMERATCLEELILFSTRRC